MTLFMLLLLLLPLMTVTVLLRACVPLARRGYDLHTSGSCSIKVASYDLRFCGHRVAVSCQANRSRTLPACLLYQQVLYVLSS